MLMVTVYYIERFRLKVAEGGSARGRDQEGSRHPRGALSVLSLWSRGSVTCPACVNEVPMEYPQPGKCT